ncbi:MAG: BatA domain-containing protein [Pirellulales bacterium]|nr:BatA domain-containing protein [Pirellulales bacterium]
MTFLAPWFLLAVAAGIIPVLLHMIHRRRAKEAPFPTLRFLRASVEKTRRRRRVQDLLLMALRVAAIVLLAVGLARPTVTGLASLWGAGSRSAMVVVLDNSASMAAVDDDQSRIEIARAAVAQILDQLDEGDQAAFLLTGGPAAAEPIRLERSQENIRQRLAQCRASHEGADLMAKISQARELLAQTDAANKQIYVVTDMQARSWNAAAAMADDAPDDATPANAPVIVVDCHASPKPNVAVGRVRLTSALPIAGLPARASVELRNASSIAQQRHVELFVDGVKQAASPAIDLPPGGRARHDFLFAFRESGLHRGEARLVGSDGLALDDRQWFAATVDRRLPVAVVCGRRHEIAYLDDAFYLRQALASGQSKRSPIQVDVIDAAQLADLTFANYRVIFCVNLPAAGDQTAQRLAQYVAEGGNVVWICGDQVDPNAYNRMNAAAGGALLPGRLLESRSATDRPDRDSWNVAFLDKSHPALGELCEPASLFESILVYRHISLDASQTPSARVLARLDDGECLMAERAVGRGRTLLLGAGCQIDQTNLPLRPIFLPMILRLTHDLAGTSQDARELQCGAPLILPQNEKPSGAAGVEIERPSGERIRLGAAGGSSDGVDSAPSGSHINTNETNQHEPADSSTLRYADTHEPGVYVVRSLGPGKSEPMPVAVNLDADESDPRVTTLDEIVQLLAGAPVLLADNPNDLTEVFQRLREGRSLWEPFLSIVLLLLIFDTLLSNQIAPKTRAFTVHRSEAD